MALPEEAFAEEYTTSDGDWAADDEWLEGAGKAFFGESFLANPTDGRPGNYAAALYHVEVDDVLQVLRGLLRGKEESDKGVDEQSQPGKSLGLEQA